jgi:hypothetical protein
MFAGMNLLLMPERVAGAVNMGKRCFTINCSFASSQRFLRDIRSKAERFGEFPFAGLVFVETG